MRYNKALQPTAQPLRGFASAELHRWRDQLKMAPDLRENERHKCMHDQSDQEHSAYSPLRAAIAVTVSGLLLLVVTGCARHRVHDTTGVAAQADDKPGVSVVSDTATLRQIPRGLEPEQEWRLNPPLAQSFENALERYVDQAEVRIIDAEIAPNTLLFSQAVRTSMLVEANGRTYRLEHRWETDDAGWGGKWVDLIPKFIHELAKELSSRLPSDS